MNKLLISTMLKFILWDKKPYILHEGDLSLGTAHYNGISWNEQYLFVSANVDTKYIIRVFDKNFRDIGILSKADLHETHQIYWYNNRLFATNTGLNRVEILEGDNVSYVAWNESTYDIDHINGIWEDGKQFYITEFGNRGDPRPPSKIKVCNLDLALIKEFAVGDGLHNIYIEREFMYTLISKIPQVLQIATTGEKSISHLLPLGNENALIRGLARTKDYWYIGVSRWEMERDKRHVGDAIVLQLDNNFNEVDRIIMPDFGPVCDIRVIDELDLAHNRIEF